MKEELIVLGIVACIGASWLAMRVYRSRKGWTRLQNLEEARLAHEQLSHASAEVDWELAAEHLSAISNRLGAAGFLTPREQRAARRLQALLLVASTSFGTIFGWFLRGPFTAIIGIPIGLYLGAALSLAYVRYRERKHVREIAFRMPLTLESLILLVESGLGVLPAIERLVSSEKEGKANNPVARYLRLAYQLAAHGMPLGQALATVANAVDHRVIRHVFLHLDISGTEGGELVPALRNLSDHAHTEWRLGVENRVRRLENLVVFPVFVSVLGLMCVTAAVPLVPVLKLKSTLQQRSVTPGGASSAAGLAEVSRR